MSKDYLGTHDFTNATVLGVGGGGLSWGDSIEGLTGIGIQINEPSTVTQATAQTKGISLGHNFNTNSSFSNLNIIIDNKDNAGTGYNTGLYISNGSTGIDVVGTGAGIRVGQSGDGGTAIFVYGDTDANSPTNGIVNYTLAANQTGVSVMQKIDTGTSTPDHLWLDLTGTKGAIRIGQTTAPSTTTDKLYNVSGSLYWNGTDLTASGADTDWTRDGTNGYLYPQTLTDKVGVGTNTPDTILHVEGASGSTLKIVDGNQGDGRVLTSDADGVASWVVAGPGPNPGYVSVTTLSTSTASLAEYNVFQTSSYSAYVENTNWKHNIAPSNVTYTPTDGRFTINSAGVYKLEATLVLESSAIVNIALKVNGTIEYTSNPYIHGSVDPVERTISIMKDLSVNDYIEIFVDGAGSVIVHPGTTFNAYKDGTASPTAGLSWIEVTTTTQAAVADYGYITNNAAQVAVTLPVNCEIGKVIKIAGSGAGGWKIAQNAGQTINFGSSSTTVGATGYLESNNRYDSVELLCIGANTTFSVINSVGNITVV